MTDMPKITILKWDQIEAIYALAVLKFLKGNRTKTAKLLGYRLRTFRQRLQRWESMGYYIPKHQFINSKMSK
jgi:DNA-binding protein Fis